MSVRFGAMILGLLVIGVAALLPARAEAQEPPGEDARGCVDWAAWADARGFGQFERVMLWNALFTSHGGHYDPCKDGLEVRWQDSNRPFITLERAREYANRLRRNANPNFPRVLVQVCRNNCDIEAVAYLRAARNRLDVAPRIIFNADYLNAEGEVSADMFLHEVAHLIDYWTGGDAEAHGYGFVSTLLKLHDAAAPDLRYRRSGCQWAAVLDVRTKRGECLNIYPRVIPVLVYGYPGLPEHRHLRFTHPG